MARGAPDLTDILLQRQQVNAGLGPIGVVRGNDLSGEMARAANAQNEALSRISDIAFDESIKEKKQQAVKDAANTVFTRGADGNLIAPDLKESTRVYTTEYNKTLGVRFGIAAQGDTDKAMREMALKNRMDPEAFGRTADSYINALSQSLPWQIRDLVINDAINKRNEYAGGLMKEAQHRRDLQDRQNATNVLEAAQNDFLKGLATSKKGDEWQASPYWKQYQITRDAMQATGLFTPQELAKQDKYMNQQIIFTSAVRDINGKTIGEMRQYLDNMSKGNVDPQLQHFHKDDIDDVYKMLNTIVSNRSTTIRQEKEDQKDAWRSELAANMVAVQDAIKNRRDPSEIAPRMERIRILERLLGSVVSPQLDQAQRAETIQAGRERNALAGVTDDNGQIVMDLIPEPLKPRMAQIMKETDPETRNNLTIDLLRHFHETNKAKASTIKAVGDLARGLNGDRTVDLGLSDRAKEDVQAGAIEILGKHMADPFKPENQNQAIADFGRIIRAGTAPANIANYVKNIAANGSDSSAELGLALKFVRSAIDQGPQGYNVIHQIIGNDWAANVMISHANQLNGDLTASGVQRINDLIRMTPKALEARLNQVVGADNKDEYNKKVDSAFESATSGLFRGIVGFDSNMIMTQAVPAGSKFHSQVMGEVKTLMAGGIDDLTTAMNVAVGRVAKAGAWGISEIARNPLGSATSSRRQWSEQAPELLYGIDDGTGGKDTSWIKTDLQKMLASNWPPNAPKPQNGLNVGSNVLIQFSGEFKPVQVIDPAGGPDKTIMAPAYRVMIKDGNRPMQTLVDDYGQAVSITLARAHSQRQAEAMKELGKFANNPAVPRAFLNMLTATPDWNVGK